MRNITAVYEILCAILTLVRDSTSVNYEIL